MTTPQAEAAYLAAHLMNWQGKPYAVFNPHNKPLEELPVIWGFNNGGSPGMLSAVLLADDGTSLGGHCCSSEGYMPHDLGIVEGSRPDRHEGFRQHYPDGYRMAFAKYDHPGIEAAYQRNQEMTKNMPAQAAAERGASMPKRIQRKRTKGWKMPEGAVSVTRPGKFGNPFVVHHPNGPATMQKAMTPQMAVASFESMIAKEGGWFPVPLPWPKGKIPSQFTTIEDVQRELRGKDLACWCPLDQPCHADILLREANR